ncbi:MAG TPA: fumarylacetoacetate hydrolase family protein [Acidimicrobiia bacterium]|nr:fumarylacetoacetate hydrolase family protein [Acidimicrobiia bacterium]
MAETEVIQSVAKELRTAEEHRSPVAPVAARFGDLTVADAYAVQLANVELRLAGGDRIIGRKIGLTSLAMQTQLGVDQPDYGHLLASMAVPNGGAVAAADLIAPRIELEVAFLLGRRLEGPGVTVADVLAATEAVFPSLEIIDSRIADWKIGLVDTVADNASSGRFVMPSRLTPIRDLDLRLLGGIMEINGVLTSWSCGAAALGDPAACVAWLANALAAYGGRLEAGEIVLSGALDKSVPVKAGDVVRAEFDRLGSAGVRFE